MKAYLVIQRGVYRHDVWGVRFSVEAARALGEVMLAKERDDYHSAEIVEVELDGDAPERIVGRLFRDGVEFLTGTFWQPDEER